MGRALSFDVRLFWDDGRNESSPNGDSLARLADIVRIELRHRAVRTATRSLELA